MPEMTICKIDELPEGEMRLVIADDGRKIGVFHCEGGEMFAIEDRCSHDDGPLAEGDWEPELCVAICPRHGARFDITTGSALTLPAFEPVETFPVRVEDGWVRVEVET